MEVLTMHNITSIKFAAYYVICPFTHRQKIITIAQSPNRPIAQSPNKVNYTLSLATFNPSHRQEAAN